MRIFYRIKNKIDDIKAYFGRFKREPIKYILNHYWRFDHTDSLPDYIMFSFEDFYKNGDLEIIDWEADEKHKQIRKHFDVIFFKINFYRKWTNNFEKLYDYYMKKTGRKTNWNPHKEKDKDFFQLNFTYNSEEDKKLFDDFFQLKMKSEQHLFNCRKEICKDIISISEWLWT